MPAESPSTHSDPLLQLVVQRFGERLTAAELEAVRQAIAASGQAAAALRAVPLTNADTPVSVPVPYRQEG